MAFVVADRVKETTSTTGTGTLTLAGATTGFQPFSSGIGATNSTYYTISSSAGSEWEVGIGTVGAGGTTLSRDSVLASSNAGSLVNLSAGVKDIYVTYPSGKSVMTDVSQTLTNKTISGSSNTLSNIANASLTNSTISGISLGSNLGTLTRGTYLTGSNYNGSTGQTWAVDATSVNTASKVVARDASGNFSAGTITAALTGNASTASALNNIPTTFTGTYPVTVNVGGAIYSNSSVTVTGSTGTVTATTFSGALSGNATTSSSTTGNAATATVLQTARTINGVSFNGSANITVADATKLPLTGGTLTGTLDINGSINAVDNIYLAGTLYHEGDTDTYLTFGTNTITLATGGSSEITVDATGVRLGDTGNGYFQPVSGNYGSVQIDGGAHGGYEGYSIGGRAVFMHNNTTTMGLYDDVNNEWGLTYAFNAGCTFYYNGTARLTTTNTGANVTGTMNATAFTGDGSGLTNLPGVSKSYVQAMSIVNGL